MYTTVARVQAEIKGTDANRSAATEQQVMNYIRTVTRRIDAYGYNFEPRFYTRKITPTMASVNSVMGLLTLGDYLLEPTTIGSNGTTLTYGTDVLNYPNDGESPAQTLRIANLSSGPIHSWYPYQGNVACNPFESVSIAGFWGMRTYYDSYGWLTSDQTCPALTSTQVTFVVSDVDGENPLGDSPLFSPGNLIRIDNEMMDVVGVDTTTSTLRVMRGVRGTTAVIHSNGTAIKVWNPEEDIANAATRQAALLYARRGAYQQVTTYPDGVSVSYPSDLLAELRATVQRFSYI